MSRMTLVLCAIIALVLLLAACKSTGQAKGGASGAPKAVCGDGVDNDKDGFCDWALGGTKCRSGTLGDTCCASASDKTETPEAETCNNLDDDCNGQVDDGLAPRQCGTTDIGTCAFGTQSCVNGGWGACTGAIEPVPEACGDALDNDCDGQADEGCAVCGNQICDAGENAMSCPTDCAPTPTPTGTVCGNLVCDAGETLSGCAFDCAPPVCGDAFCADSERASCTQDCATEQDYRLFDVSQSAVASSHGQTLALDNDLLVVEDTSDDQQNSIYTEKDSYLLAINLKNSQRKNLTNTTRTIYSMVAQDGRIYWMYKAPATNATPNPPPNGTYVYDTRTGQTTRLAKTSGNLRMLARGSRLVFRAAGMDHAGQQAVRLDGTTTTVTALGYYLFDYDAAAKALTIRDLSHVAALTPYGDALMELLDFDGRRLLYYISQTSIREPVYAWDLDARDVMQVPTTLSPKRNAVRFAPGGEVLPGAPWNLNGNPMETYKYDSATNQTTPLNFPHFIDRVRSNLSRAIWTAHTNNACAWYVTCTADPSYLYVMNLATGQSRQLPLQSKMVTTQSGETILPYEFEGNTLVMVHSAGSGGPYWVSRYELGADS